MSESAVKSPETTAGSHPTEGENNNVTEVVRFDWENGTLEQFDEIVVTGKDAKAQNDWLLASPNDPKFERINKLLDDRESGTYTPPSTDDGTKPDESGNDGGDGSSSSEGGTEKPPESGTTQEGGTDDPAKPPELVEVNGLKISKDLLGTFLKNHDVNDAIKLALEAQRNGQNFIDDLKPKYNQLQDTTVNLRKQLIEARQKIEGLEQEASERKAQPPQQEQRQPINISEIETVDFDNLDAYDPTEMEKVIGKFKAVKEKISELNKQIETAPPQKQPKVEPKPTGDQTPPAKKESPEVKEQLDAIFQSSIDRELDEIADLQRAVPALRSNVPFKDLDIQVANFQAGVAGVAGLDPNSGADMAKAAATYYSQTPEGDQLRELCKIRGVNPPDEIEKWSEIMKFRKVRSANIAERARQEEDIVLSKTGKKVSVNPYEVAQIKGNTYLDLYNSANPVDVNRIALNAKVESHREAASTAAASQNSHVPEPGPNTGTQPATPASSMSEEDLTKLFIRYRDSPNSITKDEAAFMLETARNNNFTNSHGLLDDLIKRAKG